MTTPSFDDFQGADALWVEVGTLYKNLGPDRPGNQLDLPKGTRAFFGFSAEEVPVNTVLGHVTVRVVGFEPVERSVRFADNSMDKLNLPVPGSTSGPQTYDEMTLLIERERDEDGSVSAFLITPRHHGAETEWKRRFARWADFAMGSGRAFGLLYR